MRVNIGTLLAMIIVISGAYHYYADKGINNGIEGLLIIGWGLLIESTEKIIHAIKKAGNR